MKVVKWSEWDDAYEENFIKSNHRLLSYNDEEYDAVISEIREKGYKFPGEYHQNGDYGVPIFDNGKPFMVTRRTWGYVMSKAWPEDIEAWRSRREIRQQKPDCDYVAFAWVSDEMEPYYKYPEGDK